MDSLFKHLLIMVTSATMTVAVCIIYVDKSRSMKIAEKGHLKLRRLSFFADSRSKEGGGRATRNRVRLRQTNPVSSVQADEYLRE